MLVCQPGRAAGSACLRGTTNPNPNPNPTPNPNPNPNLSGTPGSFECLYCEGADGPAPSDPDVVALDPDAADEMEQTCEIEGLAGFGACASIRVVRTQQGYYSINRRMAPMEGWGDA